MAECSCWVKYPNQAHKLKNGKWKCVDCFECVHDLEQKTNSAGGKYWRKTKCRRLTMTFNEIYEEERRGRDFLHNEIRKLRKIRMEKTREKLDELNLSGLVKRKSNGHIGKLEICDDSYQLVDFYPLTKKGEVSKKREYIWCRNNAIEKYFEPWQEAGQEVSNDEGRN